VTEDQTGGNHADEGAPRASEPDDAAPPPADQGTGPILRDRPPTGPLIRRPAERKPLLTRQPPAHVLDQPQVEESAPPPVEAPEEHVAAEPVPEPATPARGPSVAAVFASRDPVAIGQSLERVARIVLAATVFLVPVTFDPRTLDAFNLWKITLVWTLGLIALGAWWFSVYLAPTEVVVTKSRLLRVSFAFVGITTLATLFSASRALSFYGLYHRYEGLASLFLYVGFATLIVVLFRRRPDALRELAVAVAAAGGLVAFYVLLQRAGADPFHWKLADGTKPPYPIGTLGNSDFTASFLGMSAPFVLYLTITARSQARRVAWGAVGTLTLFGLLFTQGRGGLIAAVIGVAAFVLFLSRVEAARKVFLVAVTLFVLALIPLATGHVSNPTTQGVLRTSSAQVRVQLWDAAWHVFLNRPVLGGGPETFYGNYGRFRTPLDARKNLLTIADKPHNIFLSWATSTGIVGLLTYLFLLGTALYLVAGRAIRLPRRQRMLAAAFGGGLVAYLAQGVYSIDVPPLALMGWVGIGAIAALLDPGVATAGDEDAAAEPAGAPPKWLGPDSWLRRSWIGPAAVGVFLLLLLGAGLGPLRADHAAWAAERTSRGWSADTLGLYQKAAALHPHEAAYKGLEASYLERIAGDPHAPFVGGTALGKSATLYERAIAIQPRNVYFMIDAARVYARLGSAGVTSSFAVGDQWLVRAVGLDPLDPQLRDLHIDLLTQWAAKTTKQKALHQELVQRAQSEATIAQALRAGRIKQ
jgi:O-antigen ligase